MTQELFYPETLVVLGNYRFSKGIELEVYSSKDSYYDWAKVRFTQELQTEISIVEGDDASVQHGYAGPLEEVFQGYVAKGYNGTTSLNEILLKDEMMKLENTFITETFLNATPREIIGFALSKAGITASVLSSTAYPAKKIFPVSRKSVVALLQEINTAWGISAKAFFRDGVFYWDSAPKQAYVYEFVYAQNIISLGRVNGSWELVTVSAPFIHHSDTIRVDHPSVSGDFIVSKVVHSTDVTGFVRTHLYF